MDEPDNFDDSENKEDNSEFDPNKIEHSDDEEAGDFSVVGDEAEKDVAEEYERPSPEDKIKVEPKLKEQVESEEEQKPASTQKEDIIASEEREIKKIIEEGERAAAAAPAPNLPAERNVNETPAESGDGTWKWFLAGIGIMAIIGILYFGFNHANEPDLSDLKNEGLLASLNPSEFLQGWKLKSSYLSLADLPVDKKKEFIGITNLTDVATWEFTRGGETVFVWIRRFSTNDSAELNTESFIPTAWLNMDISSLSFGDEGLIGIYKIKGQNPLMSFDWQDNDILTVAYYNKNNAEYADTNLLQDKAFLVGLTRNIMGKIAAASGHELKSASINI